jgi:hypothetical protein
MTYKPLKITGMQSGLVQSREEFILPDDAYPTLENAFVWRERIKRKQGYKLLGRLRRLLVNQAVGVTAPGQTTGTFNVFTSAGITELNPSVEPGSIVITIAAPDTSTFTDTGLGTFTVTGKAQAAGSSINYTTGVVIINFNVPLTGGASITFNFNYFPNLPVMGLRLRELNNINNEETVAFDTRYAYIFNNGWQEFLPGTVWTGQDFNFFWSTNYFVDMNNQKVFWVTNDDGTKGEPIRYTNGITGTNWVNFTPQIDASGNVLAQSLAILPFRGRLLVFNTQEGPNLATSISFPQRIRWAAIGTPFTVVSAIVTTVNPNAWRDDIRGQGGFLDIPTSENILAVGFVRDNLVVFCERSTWQLRYTGRTIAPFQIEKVNSELGSQSPFSTVQFDTSIVAVGYNGISECDSYKADRIDIKIPDLVFDFNANFNGSMRVHGIRDFQQRLAFFIYPFADTNPIYPNRRLVYNYENDSWAIFTESLTALGTFQDQSSPTWADIPFSWETQNNPWLNRPASFPSIIGGNQQGFVEYLDFQVESDVSLFIQNITGNTTTPTIITSPNHNLETGQVIEITAIPTGTPFATSLNGNIFGIVKVDANNFELWIYSPVTQQFSIPEIDLPGVYIGGGLIEVRDNFSIISKKFNFIDEGQNIQLGFVDALMDNTEDGAVSLYVYLNYNNNSPVNVLPQNIDPQTSAPDSFFNSIVTTFPNDPNGLVGDKNWKRVFCAARGAFITLQWTLSNSQMVGQEQQNNVQIDAQILWIRKAGRYLPQTIGG